MQPNRGRPHKNKSSCLLFCPGLSVRVRLCGSLLCICNAALTFRMQPNRGRPHKNKSSCCFVQVSVFVYLCFHHLHSECNQTGAGHTKISLLDNSVLSRSVCASPSLWLCLLCICHVSSTYIQNATKQGRPHKNKSS